MKTRSASLAAVSAGPAPPQRAGQPDGAAYLRLVGLAALIGLPAALVAAAFLALVHELEDWLWTDLPAELGSSAPPWYLVVGLPVVGACVVLAARRLLPGDGGNSPLEGMGGGGPTPFSHAPGIALAALGTLAFGAVLGPEAPLIALGAVIGAPVARMARAGPKESAVLGAAGSFSAVSALFGGPLVAGMLMVESGLAMGAALLPTLLPGVVAAAVGYLLFVGLGDWGGLDTTALTVPDLPAYEGTHLLDLLVAVGVGVAAALGIAAIRRAGARVDSEARRPGRMVPFLLGGGLVVGLLALLADALGDDPQDVLFSGQASVGVVVASDLDVVLVLLAAKALGYAVCLGCGFRGGPIFPAIFFGVGLAAICVATLDVSPTLAVAIGAGAGMTAGTGLLFSSLLFASLLIGVQNTDALPATVFAVVAAWLTRAALERGRAPAAAHS
jgi:H+/Cl- antiporter ClcA